MAIHKAQGARRKVQSTALSRRKRWGTFPLHATAMCRLLFLVPCALCLAVAPAGATVVLPAEMSDIVNGSQVIVHGRVIDVRSEITAGLRSIHSFVTVAVNQALKGSPGPTVTFRVPQGQVGRYRRVIIGAPEFRVGEEIVVFLTGRAPAMPTVFGLNQGVRRLRGDAANRRLVLATYEREVRAVVERTR
jgi:hypothetical protein